MLRVNKCIAEAINESMDSLEWTDITTFEDLSESEGISLITTDKGPDHKIETIEHGSLIEIRETFK